MDSKSTEECVSTAGNAPIAANSANILREVKTVPVECWEIPEANGLDRIHVFWMDVAPGAGYVTIICYGLAWTAYFGGMGDRTIREFFARCDTGYMVTKMGITPALKQTKRGGAYLGKIIDAVKAAIAKATGGAA